MRRKLHRLAALLLLGCLLPSCALAAYWSTREVRCRDNRTNCLVLQAVMMGSFGQLDPADNLNIRVLSASLPRLTSLEDADFEHFQAEFQAEEAVVIRCWEIAVLHCLWADILAEPEVGDARTQAARQVLRLFLEKEDTSAAMEQRAIIRSQLTDEIVADIAQAAGVSIGASERAVYSDDWTDPLKE